MRSFLVAWHFLTAIPLSRNAQTPAAKDLARSMSWYPVVGLVMGVLLVLGDHVLTRVFTIEVVNGLLILVLAGLTRGLHMDGLADTMDGLSGGRSSDERLAIMQDARIGTMGALALVFSLGLRYAGLDALPTGDRAAVLLIMPAVGRWAMVIGAIGFSYARSGGGLGQPFLGHLSSREAITATAVVIPFLVWTFGLIGAVVALVMITVTIRLMMRFVRRLCGGITGDTLGAANELAEVMSVILAPFFIALSMGFRIAPFELRFPA